MFTDKEVQAWFGISPSTLQKMRAVNCKDPLPFTKVGGSVRYREDLLLKWLERNTFVDIRDAKEHRKGA